MRASLCTFGRVAVALMPSLVFASQAQAGALPQDFNALDVNKDSRVSFSEYQAYAASIGLSSTEAAQDFVKAAQGDAELTEAELTRALWNASAGLMPQVQTPPRAAPSFGPQPFSDLEHVSEEPIFGYEGIPSEE